MSKGTSVKDALSAWEKENEKKASESEEIILTGILPPIEKIDARFNVKIVKIYPNATRI